MTPTLTRLVFVGVLFSAPSALASPSFPSVTQEELDMVCPPQCTLCHTTDPGESGTASKDFAATLKSFGLREKDDDSLRDALEELELINPDTDEDGSRDVAELKADPPSDPNSDQETATSPGRVGICDAEFNYGCGASVASLRGGAPRTLGWTWLGLLAAVGLLQRVKTRRAR